MLSLRQKRRRGLHMSKIGEIIVSIMSDQGWTCEYHEPDKSCNTCFKLHTITAERISDELAYLLGDHDYGDADEGAIA